VIGQAISLKKLGYRERGISKNKGKCQIPKETSSSEELTDRERNTRADEKK
jgi:hypothetical protein